jgi:hypothetical protein
MADKWELDTLEAVNKMRQHHHAKVLEWSNILEAEARQYLLILPIYEYDWENVGSMIPNKNDEMFDYKIEQKNVWIQIRPENGGGKFLDTRFGGPDPMCSRKYKSTKYRHGLELKDPRNFNDIVSSCRCPHWTLPQQIADLLWIKLLENPRAKSGAVAIYNSDSFTYVALACK